MSSSLAANQLRTEVQTSEMQLDGLNVCHGKWRQDQ